jgi:hypothetical protein
LGQYLVFSKPNYKTMSGCKNVVTSFSLYALEPPPYFQMFICA